MDTIVFDIETQNFFTDPEVGWDNFAALKISVVGLYSYAQDKYFCLEEHEMEKLAEFFRNSNKTVGFSSNKYDTPVLTEYFQRNPKTRDVDLWQKERIDLLEDIEMATGRRISLSKLSEVNLGVAKDRHGSEAITLYRNGEIEKLKEYCLKDVLLTKQLYDIYLAKGAFLIPDRETGEISEVQIGNI